MGAIPEEALELDPDDTHQWRLPVAEPAGMGLVVDRQGVVGSKPRVEEPDGQCEAASHDQHCDQDFGEARGERWGAREHAGLARLKGLCRS